MSKKSRTFQNDPDGLRLPIKVDTTSNGEFIPRPLSAANTEANRLALSQADENARKTGQHRRDFLVSTAGAATTLLAFNEVNAATGKRGSSYVLPWEAGKDEAAAQDALDGDEFIFDVQGHHVGNIESWAEGMPLYPARNNFKFFAPQVGCEYGGDDPELGHIDCLTGEAYVKEVFMDSDTDIAVLSFGPAPDNQMMPQYSEGAETVRILEALDTTQRLMVHGRCMPTYQEDLDAMDETAANWPVAAWKTYTQHGPKDTGFYLDDDLGQHFIEKVRKTGVNKIAVHKGLPFLQYKENLKYASSRDVGLAAIANPDITFMIYHAGYDMRLPEGPYSRDSGSGVDDLITSMIDSGITAETQKNVYAEIGSTWRYLMRDPDQAAHVIGKLLKYVGEDRVLWGTDSIWYGSPQDQIMAFRAFQISDEFQEKYGYPNITPEIRAKVFGLNGAEAYDLTPEEVRKHTKIDPVEKAKQEYAERQDPSYLTYGPRNRREFLKFLAQEER
ncbi:MAG: amidohydrolase family protein [Rhodospirillaceae bacterium]|nr:amidohydrolase family protein [Rhodospirillaceae bacterium]